MSNLEDALRSIKVAKDRIAPNNIDIAVLALEADISDRRGLKNEWSQIDETVRKDILETWKIIIKELLL